MNISEQLAKLNKGFLYDNLFSVSFTAEGQKTQGLFNDEFDFLINSATLGGVQFAYSTRYVLGRPVNKINTIENHTLGITIYNMNGIPYDLLSKWADVIYDKKTGVYSFPDETLINITITEYLKSGKPICQHNFSQCNLINYGAKNLIYNEINEVQVVSCEVDYRTYLFSLL